MTKLSYLLYIKINISEYNEKITDFFFKAAKVSTVSFPHHTLYTNQYKLPTAWKFMHALCELKNVYTACVWVPACASLPPHSPHSTLAPVLGCAYAWAHSQFVVRIPQVCLHFRWFLVIAQCNLCDQRGKVNVDVPERDSRRERENNLLVQVQTDNAGDRHEKPFICANVSQGSNYNLLLVIM